MTFNGYYWFEYLVVFICKINLSGTINKLNIRDIQTEKQRDVTVGIRIWGLEEQ